MKEYDLERIKECVSMEDVCDILGIEKRRIGGLTSVLCPFHDDQNFGNAFIKKNNKIKCYACDTAGDIFDVYMHQTGLSLQEAAAEISDRFGLSGVTVVPQKKKSAKMPFSRSELTAIGLLREDRGTEKYPVSILEAPEKLPGYTMEKETTLGYSKQSRKLVAIVDNYIVSKKGQPMYKHLLELFENDKDTFFWMVQNKCCEYYKKYIDALSTITALQEVLAEKGIQNDFLGYQSSIAKEKIVIIRGAYKKTKKKKYHKPGRKIA